MKYVIGIAILSAIFFSQFYADVQEFNEAGGIHHLLVGK